MSEQVPGDRTETSTDRGRGPGSEPQRLCLLISTRAGVSVVELEELKTYVLGRTGADIPILDTTVSRRHARLVVGPDRVTLTDLGSSNGTRVDDAPVEENVEIPLHIGSAFELGSTTMVLQRSFPAPSPPKEVPASATLPEGVVANDPATVRLYGLLDLVAPSPLSVLILGETGVGKEVFAHAIHAKSGRASKTFLALNCAAMPDSLLEGELFGHEKGAFTNANEAKPGLFEAASGGTVLLDEIGEVPLNTQAKLLRVLESGEVLRLGGRRPTKVDVRIISATNRDLRTLMMDGRFRSDLFFRLNGIPLTLPPLRRRREDIVPLAEHFVHRVCARLKRPILTISAPATLALQRYAWPGNVRELRNVIERAVVMSTTSSLEAEHLFIFDEESIGMFEGRTMKPPPVSQDEETGESTIEVPLIDVPAPPRPSASKQARSSPPSLIPAEAPTAQLSVLPDPEATLKTRILALERDAIVEALNKTAGNQSAAAKLLGMTRRLLITRIEQYGLERPRKGRV